MLHSLLRKMFSGGVLLNKSDVATVPGFMALSLGTALLGALRTAQYVRGYELNVIHIPRDRLVYTLFNTTDSTIHSK